MSGTSTHFKELQYFNPYLYLFIVFEIFVFFIIYAMAPDMFLHLLGFVLLFWALMFSVVNMMFMKTVIEYDELSISFGLAFPMYIRRISITDIADAEPVRYDPERDYGGWGIRKSGDRRALNARGDLGVLLTMTDKTILLVGTQNPHELADIIQSLRRTYPQSSAAR